MSAEFIKAAGFRFIFPETPKAKSSNKELHEVYENLIRIRNLEEKINNINKEIEDKRKK